MVSALSIKESAAAPPSRPNVQYESTLMKTTTRLAALTVAAFAFGVALTGTLQADEPPLPAGAPTTTTTTTTQPAGEGPPLPAGAPGEGPPLPTGAPGEGPPLPTGAPARAHRCRPAPGEGPPLPTGAPGEGPPLPKTGGAETAPKKEQPKSLAEWFHQFGLNGFIDMRGGVRTQRDRYEKQASLGEIRGQLDYQKTWQNVTFKLVTDFVGDPVAQHRDIDIHRGQGWLDLRQANVAFSPATWMDVKAGRQILTWGTGDLLFINDLFPKDWQSFFVGRDVDYLKAPSDAIQPGLLHRPGQPRRGLLAPVQRRPLHHRRADQLLEPASSADSPAATPRPASSCPTSASPTTSGPRRIHRTIKGYEFAAYGYWGYWKSPGGYDPAAMRATFPKLNVYGGSVRGPVGAGIGNVEAGYYDSVDDRNGDNPFINNSQFRFLVGYERDLPQVAQDLTVGAQYYVEYMCDHDAYVRSIRALHAGMHTADEYRQVVTFRVTKLLMNQNLRLSFFAFYSPTDSDAYIRPSVNYKIDDHWTAEVGGNVFLSDQPYTFFGQFRNNTNVYVSLRYSF